MANAHMQMAMATTICLACVMALPALAESARFERTSFVEKISGREIACELAVGDSAFLRVVVAPDIDGDGPGVSSLVDPAVTAEKAELAVAVNANAFRKPDRNDRVWSRSAIMVPPAKQGYRRPVPVLIGFAKE